MNPIDDSRVERILLACDFSRWTTKAVEYAFDMAGCFDAEVLMVHGIEPIADEAVDEDAEDGDFEDFFGDLMDNSRRELEELVDEAEQRGVKARFHIEIGERWQIILQHAEQEDADMIVVGRRARGDSEDRTLGITSQRVYFGTDRPVLVVPMSDEEGS